VTDRRRRYVVSGSGTSVDKWPDEEARRRMCGGSWGEGWVGGRVRGRRSVVDGGLGETENEVLWRRRWP
jgi:hypothetical protein